MAYQHWAIPARGCYEGGGEIMSALLIHALAPPERGGLTDLRIRQPLAALARLPGIECRIDEAAGFAADRRPIAKVLLMQRRMLTLADARRLVPAMIEAGYVLVMEIDDHPGRRAGYGEGNFLSFRAMHGVQTTTEPLAEILRPHNPTVAVFANQLAKLPPFRSRQGAPAIFFGALNREADWAPIMPALNRQLARYPDVRVEVVHDRAFFEALATANKRFTPTCPYPRYLEIMAGTDIALMPLQDNPVHRCKSDVKFIEAASAGAVALASPTVYEATLRDGETGLLFLDSDTFERRLAALLDQPALRSRLALAAYDYVRKHRMLADHVGRQAAWYRWLADNRAELTAKLAARATELF